MPKLRFTHKKNSKCSNTTGVYELNGNNKWYAQIIVNGKIIKSKMFNNEKEASNEYNKLFKKYNPLPFKPFNVNDDSNEDECDSVIYLDNDNQVKKNEDTYIQNIESAGESNYYHENEYVIESETERESETEQESEQESENEEEFTKNNQVDDSKCKRIRKKRNIFEPDTEPTYKYTKRTDKKVFKVNNKILSKNKMLSRRPFTQLEKDLKLEEQDHKCNMCFKFLRLDKEFDHIIPRCFNGKDKYVNMQYLCNTCHKFKSSYLDRKIIKPMIDNMNGNKSDDFIKLINEIIKVQRKQKHDIFEIY